ncbi:MAG TPA: FHA domain-containing protein [Aggregatilineales bacterium]|nr:FHA domain-containing protein [Aggregatilineales bacterium]
MPSHISITMMSGPRDGETFRFEPRMIGDQFILTLGRRENCDICLSYDSQVSRIHAQIIFDGSRFTLKDLDSRNGTFVKETRVEDQNELAPGMLFRVGRTWMRLDPLPPDETQTARPIFDDDSDDLF